MLEHPKPDKGGGFKAMSTKASELEGGLDEAETLITAGKPPLVTKEELLHAWGAESFSERRSRMRVLAHRGLSEYYTDDIVGRLLEASPLFGEGPDKVNPAPTAAGIRSFLGLDMLTFIAAAVSELSPIVDEIFSSIPNEEMTLNPEGVFDKYDLLRPVPRWLNLMNMAILKPAAYARKSSVARTGYHFGYPNVFLETEMVELLRRLTAELAERSAKPSEAKASTMIEDVTSAKAGTAATSETITKTTGEFTMTALPSRIEMPKVDDSILNVVDGMLQGLKLPRINVIVDSINGAVEGIEMQKKALAESYEQIERITKQLAATEKKARADVKVTGSKETGIPSGKLVYKKAYEVFKLEKGKDAFSFEVPTWEWEHDHPLVPAVDPFYVFRPAELMRVLYGIISNSRVYLHGHTGTGKTTLLEQVAARLTYPFMRVNFDGDISRMDLIGRDVLSSEGGTTVSKFVDGILPQMMQQPCIACFDELDFCRPDISYVMQRMLEGDGLVLTEDGGRLVMPHPMFRAMATGNTVGQGDEHGMYQGARVQSAALLDRFRVWQKIDYLPEGDRMELIKNKVPGLRDDLREKLNKYVTEHLEAFTRSKVMQPLSPRGFLGLAEQMVFFIGALKDEKLAIKYAVESAILDKATAQDRVVLSGLVSRVFR